jgi:hypothetical protein
MQAGFRFLRDNHEHSRQRPCNYMYDNHGSGLLVVTAEKRLPRRRMPPDYGFFVLHYLPTHNRVCRRLRHVRKW